MRRLIFLAMAICVVLGGGYLFLFKRSDAVRAAKGYKRSDTPQVAADMFKKAIQNREYDMAAYYCTAGYAEQLRRGEHAAEGLGEAIDNLTYQLQERSLVRDEVRITLHALDPFPKEFQITVGKENGDTAEAVLVFAMPLQSGNQPSSGTWLMKPEIFQVFIRSMKHAKPTTVVVPMKKDHGEWKFDFPADETLQLRVGYLNDRYKNYVNPMEVVTQEVKNDPATKENVTSRLKSLLEQAAKE